MTPAARVVRELSGDDVRDRNKAGLNIVKWDLRVQPLRPLPPAPGAPAGGGGGGGGFGGNQNNGPFVLPGTYRATLTVDGKDAQAINVAVKGDPEITISDADRKIWYDTAMDLHQLQTKANDAAEMVQNANAQLTLLQQQTRNDTLAPGGEAVVRQRHEGDGGRAAPPRARRGQGGGGGFGGGTENVRGRIGQLKNAIMGSTSLPTNTQLMQIREVKAALPQVIDQANAAAGKLPGLVKEMLGAGAIFPALKPVPK